MNIDRGHVNVAVFLDLKKAFDTVTYDILLAKLHYYGLRGPYHDCLASYLNNRTQICKTNCLMFSPKLVKCGAPIPIFRLCIKCIRVLTFFKT